MRYADVRCALVLPVVVACHEPVSPTHASIRDSVSAEVPTGPPVSASPPRPCSAPTQRLGDGLTAEVQPLRATPAIEVEPCFDVVRADPARYRLRILTKERDGTTQPAPIWRERYNLVAVTNLGMFHAEGKPVGLVVQDGVTLKRDNKKFGGYLAFGPRAATDAPIVITGRDCPGFDLEDLKQRYGSIMQSNRLVDCNGNPLPWKDTKQYSASAVGLDRKGNILFMHARAPVTMTDLSRAVADLDVAGALFLEGGPEASLVVRGSDAELSRVGSYETDFVENDENKSFWWLPNVLALEAI